MDNRGLYPTLSTKNSGKEVKLMMDFLSCCDGDKFLIDIAEILNVPIWDLYHMVDKLKDAKLISTDE